MIVNEASRTRRRSGNINIKRRFQMTHNNFTYTICEASKQSDIDEANYPTGNTSADGTLIAIDRNDQHKLEACSDTPRPSYVTEEEFPNWPYLTHEEVLKLVRRPASSDGASDGWCWAELI